MPAISGPRTELTVSPARFPLLPLLPLSLFVRSPDPVAPQTRSHPIRGEAPARLDNGEPLFLPR